MRPVELERDRTGNKWVRLNVGHMIMRCDSRYVLATKRDDQFVVGGKTDGSWEWGCGSAGIFFEIETARDIGDEVEFTLDVHQPTGLFISEKRTCCVGPSKRKNVWSNR